MQILLGIRFSQSILDLNKFNHDKIPLDRGIPWVQLEGLPALPQSCTWNSLLLNGEDSGGCFRKLPELGRKLNTAEGVTEKELRSYRDTDQIFF